MFPIDIAAARRLASGPLAVPARIARIGLQTYSDHVELRPASEVFHGDSLASFEGAPLIVLHRGWVDRLNVQEWSVGYVRNVRRDGIYVAAELVVHDESVISQLMHGTSELSAGYSVEVEETPGVYEGEKYDAIQRSPRANHVALVPSGRAGPNVRVY